ncbi:DUF3883 domain-containing protein [Asanoa sp. NPDC049573]|uniref:protein NO VEIN domain-containing protein n=1 Tax=Asanoa sp. NPDC049573 TaxID=3155396 RepID=UPI0034288E2C
MTDPLRLTGNRTVEDAAIAFVVRWEAEHGRTARDIRGTGAAADVAGSERVIEVKAYGQSARGQDLWLEPRQRSEAAVNPRFWLYVVENVRQGNPAHFRLLQIGGEDLRRLMERAVERRYFTVPWPVAVYDALAAHPPT